MMQKREINSNTLYLSNHLPAALGGTMEACRTKLSQDTLTSSPLLSDLPLRKQLIDLLTCGNT